MDNFELQMKEYRRNYFEPLKTCADDILHKSDGVSLHYEARTLNDFLTDIANIHGFEKVALIVSNHIKGQLYDGRQIQLRC